MAQRDGTGAWVGLVAARLAASVVPVAGLGLGLWAYLNRASGRYPDRWMAATLVTTLLYFAFLFLERDRQRLERWTGVRAPVWAAVGAVLMLLGVVYPFFRYGVLG